LKVKFSGTGTTSDWTSVHLYWDADHSGDINGADSLLASATGLTAGKATFTGLSQAIQDGFSNGRDYLVCVDVASGATVNDTFIFEADAADVTVSAGTVSAPFGTITSNTHTIRVDNGCEMDVQLGGNSIPSGTATSYDVGYISTSGGSLTFSIVNSGTGTLNLTGTPTVEVTQSSNCSVSVTSQPATSISGGNSSNCVVNVDPASATAFGFTLQIENNDFDEFPYVVQCHGTAQPLPDISIEYNANPVADGGNINIGAYTAGVPATMNLTIVNNGQADLNLTGTPLVSFPTQFYVNCSLQTAPSTPVTSGGGTSSFTIEFTPAGSGNWTFEFWVESDDPDEDPYNISVDGSSPAVTATHLGVFLEPGSANATLPFGTQPIVSVQDANGAVDRSDNSTVIVASITGGTGASGASLGGTLTATCSGGYATFTDLVIDKEGMAYTLTFTDQSGTLTATTSQPFDVGSAPPKKKKKKSSSGSCSTGEPGCNWMAWCAALALLAFGLRAIPKKT
jgi:hypothetical protein